MATRRPLPPDTPKAPAEPGADFRLTRNDLLVAVGSAAMDLFDYTMTSLDSHRSLNALGLVLSAVAALPLLLRRRYPPAVLAAVLAVNLALNLTAPLAATSPPAPWWRCSPSPGTARSRSPCRPAWPPPWSSWSNAGRA
ncbi:hypothetical protein GXW82_08595 [Streptacidiphilus sp. 4-A2]|nr:hypothetical protein [Streptacidiphilus sp. 4-A2]